MSRIGKTPIKIVSGVKVQIQGQDVHVEGPKGKLKHRLPEGISLKKDADHLVVEVQENLAKGSALHGLSRTLVANMIHGVHAGFTKELDIVGVGYRASIKNSPAGSVLSMTLGYSHPVDYVIPEGISAKVEANTHIVVSGFDKVLVGMVAAKIRSFKKPEPYQGKGVKYTNEHIIRKQGKSAGAK